MSRFLPVQLIHLSHLLSDSHEHLDHPGKFLERDLPDYSGRDWGERAFTIGIGGCVLPQSTSFSDPEMASADKALPYIASGPSARVKPPSHWRFVKS